MKLLFLGIPLHGFSYFVVFRKVEPFLYFSYPLFWWSYILIADSLIFLREGRYVIFRKNFPLVLIFSVFYWCIFELINLRIANWFYVAVTKDFWARFLGYFISYGTVIPAIIVTKELISPLFKETRLKAISLKNCVFFVIILGLVFMGLLLAMPLYFFPLCWIFPILLTEGFCYRKGFPSFIRELEEGKGKELFSSVFSGLVCGFLWEFWNWLSVTRWIYSVPFFEGFKVFEMPLPGYLGFLVFSVGTVSFFNLICSLKLIEEFKVVPTLGALVFSIFVFFLIDRYTVFSYLPGVSELHFIEESKRKEFAKKGIMSSYAIDRSFLSFDENKRLELLHLKGLGYERYRILESRGIDSVKRLAELSQEELQEVWGEKNLRRIRVYLKEARKLSGLTHK